ncbi:AAA family ATPase [Pannus brasiliensis CCIBt3594]|uniref:AAA family ATPase n=1 Tax=Pannus brasiliensis CCIBt3594 TaxID=1427578 RepID=A0AAW9QPS4_9CHRO
MRYTSFTICNFKGIRELTLDLGGNPASKVFILVGLNESGKTTIMEALSFFYENIKNIDEEYLTLCPSGVISKDSLIPKNRKDNFTDKTSIKAHFELDKEDLEFSRKTLKEHGFVCEEFHPRMSIELKLNFENSLFKNTVFRWETNIFGKESKKRNQQKLNPECKAWNSFSSFIRKNIPPIIYYPNFLFNFPDVIYLEESDGEGIEQAFYRRLVQDILDSLPNQLNVKTHIIDRVGQGTRQQKEAVNSVLNKMGSQITKLVFSENLSVFRTDITNKSIIVSYPEIDEEHGIFIELQLKDGEDSYYIRERSLGFRWFFTFLLFTQFRVLRSQGNTNLVFLFDEPASNLHQAAQQRLVGALEKLTKSGVSVIYSTHSHHLINPKWLENTYIVRNKALEYEKDDIDNFEPTNIEVAKYRNFVTNHPDQYTYFQPILDILEYRPSNLEPIQDVVMVEGKNDFYTLSYFQDVILQSEKKLALLPGMGSSGLDTVIRLYYAWGKKFTILLDSDKEGHRQKKRYQELFENIVKDRLFVLEDVDPSWSGYATEKLFDDRDRIAIQNSIDVTKDKFDKKYFNLAIQENLAKAHPVSISQSTKDRFKKLLNVLRDSLEAQK